MKTCPYCGTEYPDNATVCATDGETLPDSIAARKKVSGVWRGVFGYGEHRDPSGTHSVAFTLKLKQGWLERFTGSVTEDAPAGTPGTGTIDGYFNSSAIEFTKQMPVGYVRKEDGTLITLREYFLAKGNKCEHELPSSPILYLGALIDTNRMQGTWTIQPRRISFPAGQSFSMPVGSGFWCAQFVTTDLKVDPAGGPTGPLFDKSLLSVQELEAVDGVPYRSLGRFTVADAERFLDRFGQDDIRFELKRDDTPMRQMTPITAVTGGLAGAARLIEIFVHPDDEEAALKITGADNQV